MELIFQWEERTNKYNTCMSGNEKVLWRKRGTGSAGAGGDYNDTFLMRARLSVRAAFDQRPKEQKEPFMQVSGKRTVQTEECGWRGVRWRKRKRSG